MRALARAALLAIVLALLLPATGRTWGGATHHHIARNYSRHLPASIDGLRAFDTAVDDACTDPDERKPYTPGESEKHYLDIDVYPEFLAGTLPHDRAALEALHGAGTVLDNGVLPWAVGETTARLAQQFRLGQWSASAVTIADLCHYVADATQPLHCTENYDGQMTGQGGIHSRYESTMMTSRLAGLSTPATAVAYRASAVEAAFDCIAASWACVEGLLLADEEAVRPSNGVYDAAYYDRLWAATGAMTRARIDSATVLTASLVYSAWVDAGRPVVPGSSEPWVAPGSGLSLVAGPTPFHGRTTVRWSGAGRLRVEVFDVRGARVARLGESADGEGVATWAPGVGSAHVGPGVYFVRLAGAGTSLVRRVCLLD